MSVQLKTNKQMYKSCKVITKRKKGRIMNIYLAGDSIVQNYTEEEFIAGWGQYLKYYVTPDTKVFNCAKGGRSSRLFLNEGRFDKIDESIQAGDYLLIEFCHNDDSSKGYSTMFNRMTELGIPDEDGRYPVIPGERVPKDYIPKEYIDALMKDDSIADKEAVLASVKAFNNTYPNDTYYPYSPNGEKGSFKWFIKQYIDMAREHNAVPVLVTAPARTAFNKDGTIKDGPGLHGGDDFCYIRAMKQIGEETHTPVIDLFSYTVKLFESIGEADIHKYTSIKKGINKGKWPEDFVNELAKKDTVSENTHFNKYGAWLITKGLVNLIKECDNEQVTALKNVIVNSDYKVASPLI